MNTTTFLENSLPLNTIKFDTCNYLIRLLCITVFKTEGTILLNHVKKTLPVEYELSWKIVTNVLLQIYYN